MYRQISTGSGTGGTELLLSVAAIVALEPELRTAPIDDQTMTSGGRAADGYLVKVAPADELLRAIRWVAAGQRVVDPALAVAALEEQEQPITVRELDGVRLLAEGATDREIARSLHLSPGTVRNYLSRVMTAWGARNRVDVVRIGLERGWLWPTTSKRQ